MCVPRGQDGGSGVGGSSEGDKASCGAKEERAAKAFLLRFYKLGYPCHSFFFEKRLEIEPFGFPVVRVSQTCFDCPSSNQGKLMTVLRVAPCLMPLVADTKVGQLFDFFDPSHMVC